MATSPTKGIKIFRENEKKKCKNMVVNDIKIFLNMKNEGW